MIKKTKTLILFSLLFSIASISSAQDNNSSYFDDGKFSNANNIIKTDIAQIICGEYSIHYERVLTDAISIEGSAGLLGTYYIPEPYLLIFDDYENLSPEGGYSYSLHGKYNFTNTAPEGAYMGLRYKYRNFDMGTENIIYQDYNVTYGLAFIVGQRILLEGMFGVGFRFRNGPETDDYDAKGIMGLSGPIQFKIGYLL